MLKPDAKPLIDRVRQLEQFLSDPTISAMDRLNNSTWLNKARQDLERTSRPPNIARVRLTFRGPQVYGTHGINAEFGLEATLAYQEAVGKRANHLSRLATNKAAPLEPSLAIVGVAQGSFGFMLEEIETSHVALPDLETTTFVNSALSEVRTALEIAGGDNKETFCNHMRSLDGGTASAIKDFVEITGFGGASFHVEDWDSDLELEVPALLRAAKWAQDLEIQESTEMQIGTLTGVFAESKEFEFIPDGRNRIEGEIGAMLDAHRILQEWGDQRCIATFKVTRKVRATRGKAGRKVYELIEVVPPPPSAPRML